MAGLKGKSEPPGNMNAFKHGLAAIQKRREESVLQVNFLIPGERLFGRVLPCSHLRSVVGSIPSCRAIAA